MLSIQSPLVVTNASIPIPSGKSISNRLLILNALAANPVSVENLSPADDTSVLQHLINSANEIEDCHDGGTTARFLIALRCVQNRNSLITGSASLRIRPMQPLFDALKSLGASFEFPERENFLPVKIVKGITNGGIVVMDASISSQFISALMMIGPVLKGGLTIQLKNEIVSAPYLHTTAVLMQQSGVDILVAADHISIPEGQYTSVPVVTSSDWSSAGYWYAIAAALPGSSLHLHGLKEDGLQADQQVVQWMRAFGVTTVTQPDGVLITSEKVSSTAPLQLDFTNCPDLAQTFAVLAAVKGVALRLTGLSTLRTKETDRIHALQTELTKAGAKVFVEDSSMLIESKVDPVRISKSLFSVYNDHRMAMALSILSCTGASVKIDTPDVVSKSYPGYWDDLRKAGFTLHV
jgi:3-phosphoshikimate 1-carboxyvinyltransferase